MEIEKNIAFFIEQQFPGIYREEGAELVQLVKDYYTFLETQENQTHYVSRRFFDYKDINTTLASMIIFFQKKFLADLPLKEDVVRFVVRNILDLYKRKGTTAGIQLFFSLFYREYDVEIYYPAKQMLKVSNSTWNTGTYLQMIPNDNEFESKTGKQYTYNDLLGRNVTGSASKAKAAVDKINFVILNGILTPVIYIDRVQGTFQKYDDLICKISGEVVVFGRVNGSLSKFNVDTTYAGTSGNEIGDVYDVQSASGDSGKAIVTKVTDEFNGEIEYNILNGGYGYSVENTRLIVSNQTLVLSQPNVQLEVYERLQDTAGNQGYVVGQSGVAIGVRTNPGDTFDITRTISTVDRSPNVSLVLSVVSPDNQTSPGDLFPDTGVSTDVKIGALSNEISVEIIGDQILPFASTPLNAADYESTAPMSGSASPVNLSTPLNQAFDISPLTIGTIERFDNINPGTNYVNDVFAIAEDGIFSNLERYDQIINLIDGAVASNFDLGEIIEEENTGLEGIIRKVDSQNGYISITPFDYKGFSAPNGIIKKGSGQVFSVASVEIDYNSKPLGKNAVIDAQTEFATGRIQEVAILNSGFAYIDNSPGFLLNSDGDIQAAGTLSVNTQGVTEGFWSDFSSHINGYKENDSGQLEYYDSGMRVQDSNFYQEYSYQIKSTLNPREYEKLLKENVHLAGTKMFADFLFKAKTKSNIKIRALRKFNDDGRGSPLDVADPDNLTSDISNFTVDSTVVTADSVPV